METGIDRRGFLGRSALGAAALATAVGARGQEAPSQRVVVGVMGLGRGLSLAEQFATQPGVEVRYCCDVDSKRAAEGAAAVEKSGAPRPQEIGDFRRILDDSEVDALICAAPNHWHAPATILACAAGKHVYVEKPCSHNPREGELMAEAARKYQRAVQVGTQRRSSATIRRAMERLHGGAIGKVYASRATFASNRGSIGTGQPAEAPPYLDYEHWQGPAPRRPFLNNRIHYNWHWFWHWGNGELGNNGVHFLDVCRWGLQVDFPERVTSLGGRYAFQDDQETPDTQSVALAFAGDKLITWQCNSCNPYGSEFVNFYGDQGTMLIADGGDYTLLGPDNTVVETEKGTRGDIEHIVDFLAAVREGRTSGLNSGIEDAFKSTTLCHLGNIAQRVGRSLRCNAADGHILDDAEASALWAREYEPGWEPVV
jgi:predicted dehydrogenase